MRSIAALVTAWRNEVHRAGILARQPKHATGVLTTVVYLVGYII